MKRVMRNFVPREQRRAALETALERFRQHYKVAEQTLRRLRDKLLSVPSDVEMQERWLLAGLPARPSDLRVPRFNDNLLSALKEVGWWSRFPPKGRDLLRKRLSRTYSTIPRSEGRQPYPYADLEKDYADAIIVALAESERIRKLRERPEKTKGQTRNYSRPLPVSRSGESKELIGGPALELLRAALAHALPYSGAPGAAGAEKRLSGLEPSEKKRSDS